MERFLEGITLHPQACHLNKKEQQTNTNTEGPSIIILYADILIKASFFNPLLKIFRKSIFQRQCTTSKITSFSELKFGGGTILNSQTNKQTKLFSKKKFLQGNVMIQTKQILNKECIFKHQPHLAFLQQISTARHTQQPRIKTKYKL